MPDLRDTLQATLGDAYTIERELGGGGMSRVFLAIETRFARQVVIKVLSPELAAGLSAERFEREIRVAAQLQNPHVVPVLSAGDSAGLPYYTMPFVQGESLRARLGRGPLSIAETTFVLRDVALALEYAHARGLVHRDIKPDNVLLSGGSAVVTDFGIAKALSAARTGPRGATLTQLGTSIGTPAYMAPEQAAGDPDVDHRADIYAFGCTAYELLTGVVPFADRTPQRMLAAHMTEAPRGVRELRPDAPPALADLVMRCLEKDPAARPHTAEELRTGLESVSTSGASTAMPAVLFSAPGMLKQALLLYTLSFVIVAAFAKAVVIATGVPDWVFPGALLVMALGLPVLLLTAYVQRLARHAVTATPTLTPGGSSREHSTMTNLAVKASPHITWRRTARGGLYALGGFAVLVVAIMAMRQLGIGPAASLLAAGELKRAPLIVTDFKAVGDTSLGNVVTEAVRSDLAQSSAITLLAPDQVTDALGRMRRTDARLDLALARELAQREGVAAIVDGGIQQVGTSYIVTLRLVSADSGRDLASFQGTAASGAELVPTIGELTKKLRRKIGESLKTVRESQPLEVATTASLPALRKYTEGVAARLERDTPRAIELLREAVTIDSAFGIAYARLAGYAIAQDRAMAEWAADRAFALRDRMSPVERATTKSAYYEYGPAPKRNGALALRASEERARLEPDSWIAVHNLALSAGNVGDLKRADSLMRRAAAMAPKSSFPPSNLLGIAQRAGTPPQAIDSLENEYKARSTSTFTRMSLDVDQLVRRAAYDSAEVLLRTACAAERRIDNLQGCAMEAASLALLRGRIREFERQLAAASEYATTRGLPAVAIENGARLGAARAWLLADRTRAIQVLDSVTTAARLRRVPVADRPLFQLAVAYALAGRPDQGRNFISEAKQRLGEAPVPGEQLQIRNASWKIALARGDASTALAEMRNVSGVACTACRDYPYFFHLNPHASLARAHDIGGNADSALVHYEQFVERARSAFEHADMHLAESYKRIGELAEAKNDEVRAIGAYERFVNLWKDADIELQPQVRDVRARLARLRERHAKSR